MAGLVVSNTTSQTQIDGEYANFVLLGSQEVSGTGVFFKIDLSVIYAVRAKNLGEYCCILPSFESINGVNEQGYRIYGSVVFYKFGEASLLPEGNFGLVVYDANQVLKYSSNHTGLRVVSTHIGEVPESTPLDTDIVAIASDSSRTMAWLIAQVPRITHAFTATKLTSSSWGVTYNLASIFIRNDPTVSILGYRSFHNRTTRVTMNSNYQYIKESSRRYDYLLVDVTSVGS